MNDFNPNVRLKQYSEHFEIPVNRIAILYRNVANILATEVKIRGLDLSHWNADENIDFVTLKANGIDFVILKVTEHTSFVDPTFKTKYERALAAGIVVMPYHFFRGNYGGASQASHCINTLKTLGFIGAIEYIPIIWYDVETSDGVSITIRRNRLLAALQTTVSNGFEAGAYSSPYYWNSLIGLVDWIQNYWQWDAHWTNASIPTLPMGWSREKTIVWQNGIHPIHSWIEKVIGATGNVDHNYFYGSLDDLKKILQFPIIPPPNGECNCKEELTFLAGEIDANSGYIDELNDLYSQLYNLVKVVEREVNFLKLEVYNLQQSDIVVKSRLDSLESGQTELYSTTVKLDERLYDLEALEAEFRRILCGG